MRKLRGLVAVVFVLFALVTVVGCPRVEKTAPPKGASGSVSPLSESPSGAGRSAPAVPDVEKAQKMPELGVPLVENVGSLKRLDPDSPVWLDLTKRRVVFLGQICQTDAPLEMFACLANTKEHEAIVAAPTKAYVVHAALLAVGARPGRPVQFVPEYVPASGTEVEIAVCWKNDKGEIQTALAQDWVQNTKTGKAMEAEWVFGGSGFWLDEATGQRHYQAECGDFICVSNFTTAMLDLAVESSQSNAELSFRAFSERIPPLGTVVTIVLTPKRGTTESDAERLGTGVPTQSMGTSDNRIGHSAPGLGVATRSMGTSGRK